MDNTGAFEQLVENLIHPKKGHSQLPFWFWNGALTPEVMREQLRLMAKQGVHGACPHPRFGMDRREYLEEAFWLAMDATVDEARKLGSSLLLYDEYNWPSGGAGGRVTDGYPHLHPRGLDYSTREVRGPGVVTLQGFQPGEPESGRFEKIIAAFNVPTDCPSEDGGNERPYNAILPWGEISTDGSAICGKLPPGNWRILVFFESSTGNPSPLDTGSNAFVDFLNPETGKRFIELTHNEYRKRYSGAFGSTIVGIFTDEPSTICSGPFPWTGRFLEEFEKRRGYSLLSHLPALCDDSYPDGRRYRAAYWRTVAELFEEAFIRPMADWCKENKIALTGHFFEESLKAWPAAPQLMNWLRQLDWPGMDALGKHSQASASKIPASVAHLQGKPLLCEALGLADGWNITPKTIRRGMQFLGIAGTSVMVPHAFHQTIENPRNECPPSFFVPSPLWRHYHRIAKISDRLCAFNSTGCHKAPLAVYYPIESLWADGTGGRGQGGKPWEVKKNGNRHARHTVKVFDDLVNAISYGPWDCDIVDAAALAQAEIQDGSLKIGPEHFRCLVLPSTRTLDAAVAGSIASALKAGLLLVILGDAPTCLLDDAGGALERFNQALETYSSQILKCSTAQELCGWLDRKIPSAAVIGFPDGTPEGILVQARKAHETALWLIVNDNEITSRFQILLPVEKQITENDLTAIELDSGSKRSLPAKKVGDHLLIELELGPLDARIVLASAKPARGNENTAGVIREIKRKIPLDAWTVQVSPSDCKIPAWKMRERGWEALKGWQQPDCDDSTWCQVVAGQSALGSASAQSALFRAVLPPGAKYLRRPLPLTGEYELFVNGRLAERRLGPPLNEGLLEISHLCSGLRDILALEVSSHSALSGLSSPLEVCCEAVSLPALMPWTELGLGWYSGIVSYQTHLSLNEIPGTAWLDLGDVEHDAELLVNGEKVAELPWPPYRVEIAKQLRKGENTLTVTVANTLANRFTWDNASPARTGQSWGVIPRRDPSGLLGPVWLELG